MAKVGNVNFRIGAIARDMFFDSPAVMKALNAAQRKVLMHQGNYVKKVARNSIKRAPSARNAESATERQKYRIAAAVAKKKGLPPPRVRAQRGSPAGRPPYSRTGLLKRMIFAGYDTTQKSAVIGPQAAGPSTADILEYGGRTRLTTSRSRQMITVKPRPFIGPALEKSKPRFAEMWRDSVKK